MPKCGNCGLNYSGSTDCRCEMPKGSLYRQETDIEIKDFQAKLDASRKKMIAEQVEDGQVVVASKDKVKKLDFLLDAEGIFNNDENLPEDEVL